MTIDNQPSTNFVLLHTNDFHNHLTDAQANYLRHLREAVGARGLLVDAGDAVASGNITFRPSGETILKTMNIIGYDAMTVGNREFHLSRMGFHCKVGLAKFPILCANVRASGQVYETTGEYDPSPLSPLLEEQGQVERQSALFGKKQQGDPPVRSYILRTMRRDDGRTFRIVFFGLTVPMITARMLSRKVSAYIFEDPILTATRLVPHLKQSLQPDLLVALTHIGHGIDRKLAQAVPGIDLIIGGHSHTQLEAGERVGETLIVQTGCFGHNIGRVDVESYAGETGANVTIRLEASLLSLPLQPTEAQMREQIASLHHATGRNPENSTTQ